MGKNRSRESGCGQMGERKKIVCAHEREKERVGERMREIKKISVGVCVCAEGERKK